MTATRQRRRQRVRESIVVWEPVDVGEAAAKAECLAAYDRLVDPFDRDADLTHVTGSAIVVGPEGVLLHRHRRLRRWLQPGGHIDGPECPWEAANREALEETGLVVVERGTPGPDGPALLQVDVHDGGRGHTHLDLRYLFGVEGSTVPNPPPGESQEVRWFGWPEALELVDSALARLFQRLSHVNYPAHWRPR